MAPPEDFCRQDQLELFMTMMIILKIVKLKIRVILKSLKKNETNEYKYLS